MFGTGEEMIGLGVFLKAGFDPETESEVRVGCYRG